MDNRDVTARQILDQLRRAGNAVHRNGWPSGATGQIAPPGDIGPRAWIPHVNSPGVYDTVADGLADLPPIGQPWWTDDTVDEPEGDGDSTADGEPDKQ